MHQPTKCLNCQGPHSVTARICPEYSKVIEIHKPTIAKQLAHYILNKLSPYTQSDNAISTDVLRASTLEASNKEEFLASLFENCKQIILMNPSNETNNSQHYTNECDLNETYSTLPGLDAISTQDIYNRDDNTPIRVTNNCTPNDHSDETEQFQLPKDTPQNLQEITQTPPEITQTPPEITQSPPDNTHFIPQSFTPTPLSQTYQDCQYGLTYNGIQIIDKLWTTA